LKYYEGIPVASQSFCPANPLRLSPVLYTQDWMPT
jgi:hypothetical protein